MKLDFDGHATFVGQGSGSWREAQPTLLLLHGAGMDRTVWFLHARYFARHGFNVLTPDLPGHGLSAGTALDTIESQALWLNALLDALAGPGNSNGLSLHKLVLGGHSMGALVAIEAAAQQAERVAQLLLFACGYPMSVGQPLLAAAKANDVSAIDMITIFGHSFDSRLGHNPVSGISVLNSAAALLARAAPGVLYTDLAACNAYQGGPLAAEKLSESVPVTIIAGDADRMTPARSTRAVSELLAADVRTLNNCGHMMMSEQPEATLSAMRATLSA